MAIHLYEDITLTQRVSEGDLANPDDDTYNGTDGETKDKELFVANEQTTLASALASGETSLQLSAPLSVDGEIIIVDAEQMRILSGGGTTVLAVERGYGGTTPAAHDAGAVVYSGYDYTGLVIEPVDVAGGDESGWYALALTQAGLDTAVGGAPLNLGDKAHDATLSFWRRCTVPAGTPVQNKTDIKLRITGTENPIL
ncbi:conserved hypothetical protein [uncultured Desulfobacterium sp.]|uniref:Uncharacterized protein n=1 Tax=uncultured Desulfobacterium sp. TaxID=201089 RepID=A0A445MYG8_9BACT|nr:conserved hypothetical protein [uncultured Desulfobacterium sp.]